MTPLQVTSRENAVCNHGAFDACWNVVSALIHCTGVLLNMHTASNNVHTCRMWHTLKQASNCNSSDRKAGHAHNRKVCQQFATSMPINNFCLPGLHPRQHPHLHLLDCALHPHSPQPALTEAALLEMAVSFAQNLPQSSFMCVCKTLIRKDQD